MLESSLGDKQKPHHFVLGDIASAGLASVPHLDTHSTPTLVLQDIHTLGTTVPQLELKSLCPLPANHEFYTLIGRVAAEWARLEHLLDEIIWSLSGIDQKLGSCITGQLVGQYGRFSAIHALAVALGAEKKILDRIVTMSGKCGELSKKRNRFVHDAWYLTQEDQVEQFKSFSPKDGIFGINEVSEAYAEETITRIRDKVKEVEDIWRELLNLRRT